MKKDFLPFIISILFGLSLLLLVACGGGGGGNDDSAVQPASNRYALVIGIDKYALSVVQSLSSCVNDANGFAAALASDGTLWKPASITVKTDSSASLAAIRSKFQELANTAQSGDIVVYYQSSHGGDSGTSDVSPDDFPDATFLYANDACYQDEEFAADLAMFRDGVSIIVVIDACYAAGMYKSGLVFDFPQKVMKAYSKARKAKSGKGANVGWMASSEYNEQSLAGSTYSKFTQYILEAFANGDANSDGNITFKELFDYAKLKTQPVQNPQSLNDALLSSIVAVTVSSEPSDGGGGNSNPPPPDTSVYEQTEILKGTWHFAYTIITTFTDDYALTTIPGDTNPQGGYYIYGTDQYGGPVIASYWPDYGSWALLDEGTIIDKFYYFYTDGTTILPNSCYYQIDQNNNWSICYTLSGNKISSSSLGAFVLLSKNMKEANEQLASQESTNHERTQDSIVEKYIIMKYLND